MCSEIRQYAIYCLCQCQNTTNEDRYQQAKEPLQNVSIYQYKPNLSFFNNKSVVAPVDKSESSEKSEHIESIDPSTTSTKRTGRKRSTVPKPEKPPKRQRKRKGAALTTTSSVTTTSTTTNLSDNSEHKSESRQEEDPFTANYSIEPESSITPLADDSATLSAQRVEDSERQQWKGLYFLLDLYYELYSTPSGFLPVDYSNEESYVLRSTILECLCTIYYRYVERSVVMG